MIYCKTLASVIAVALGAAVTSGAFAQAEAPVPVDAAAAAKAAAANEKAALAAAKAAEKARQKQVKVWQAQYGPGPYPDELDAWATTREEKLREYYRVLYYDGEHNAVLNFERLGLLAMEMGYYGDAEKAFDGALDRIEAFYGKDKQAQKATDATRMEVNKDYKGEPYERAMAYYYRGLLYMRKGDYDNARASFKAAEYQDTVSQDETYQSDFGLLTYLQGWASQCAGDKSQAADSFEQAKKIDASLKTPAESDNVLVLAELGSAPVKAGEGQYKEKMVVHQATDFPENRAVVTLGEGAALKTWPLDPGASIYTQASTRGGRAIDGILNGKAQTKDALNTAGDVATAIGNANMFNNSGLGIYGQLGGLLFKAASSTVRPAADVRVWDSLPDSVLISTTSYTAAKAAGVMPVSMAFMNGETPIDVKGTPPMVSREGKCTIVWARSRSVTALPAAAPGDVVNIAANRKRDPAAWAKDQAFRLSLGGGPGIVSTAR